MISNAVSSGAVSRVLGYKLTTGDFRNSTPNLPIRIAILGEANDANQASLSLAPVSITSAQQAGELYGFGSPIYTAMRILRPISGGGVGSIETVVYPQGVAGGAEAEIDSITVTGTATANAVHTVVINGRRSLDGESYSYSVVKDDTASEVAQKIADAVNGVLGCPYSATVALGVVTLTAKWSGYTGADMQVKIDAGSVGAGLTYIKVQETEGSGTPSVATSLTLFGEEWNNIIVNTYGEESTVLDSLEAYNGIPSPTDPTGRYAGIVFRPFVALFGTSRVTGLPASFASRANEVTNVLCPTPLSSGLPMEGSANFARLLAIQANDNPELDVAGQNLPDMPIPDDLSNFATIATDFSTYEGRNLLAKSGISTVNIVNGSYQIQDLVTTYHPTGELNPQFRFVRSLIQDFNVKFGYRLQEELYVIDHLIANDDDIVRVSKVIKPKTWKTILNNYFLDLVSRGLIVDAPFSKDSLIVGISTSNPDRLETFFKYKRSGFDRIASTTVEAGFNYGTV
jgi:phage tail sheath gpL-like